MIPSEELVTALAAKYWLAVEDRSVTTGPDQIERVWDAVDAIMKVTGAAAWLLVALAEDAVTESRRGYLAAGPLEDLLEGANQENLEILDSQCARVSNLADLLYRVNDPSNGRGMQWLQDARRRFPRPAP